MDIEWKIMKDFESYEVSSEGGIRCIWPVKAFSFGRDGGVEQITLQRRALHIKKDYRGVYTVYDKRSGLGVFYSPKRILKENFPEIYKSRYLENGKPIKTIEGAPSGFII